MFSALSAIAIWCSLPCPQKHTLWHGGNGRFVCYKIPRLLTNDCIWDDTKLHLQSEIIFDGQPPQEIKRRRLSLNEFQLMDGIMSRTIPRVAAYVYNVIHTL